MSNELNRLSEDQLREIRELAKSEKDRRIRERPADFFPWHDIQRWVLDAFNHVAGDVRIMLIAGGNRGGKSKAAMGILSHVLRRKSGLNKQLLTTDKYTGEIVVKDETQPVTVWIAPPTLEKARNDWLSPQDQMGLKYWLGDLFVDIRRSPDLVLYSRPPGVDPEKIREGNLDDYERYCDKILIKSQDQALETFESSEVDVVIFDEEVQNQEIWNSCLMRVGTTHGAIVMAYTPLHGLTWSYKRYWKPLVKDGLAEKVADRCWIHAPTGKGEEGEANIICAQLGSADNPRARAYSKEIEHDRGMSEAEKAARLRGEYGYVEGALLRALAGLDVLSPLPEHEIYVVDSLPGMRVKNTQESTPGEIAHWFLVSDPNKSYGATLSAVDTDGNLFFVSEHLEESWPDRRHAEAFKEMERIYQVKTGVVHRYADPGSAGAQSIVNMQSLGIPFNTMPKGAGSVSSSIKKLRGMTYVDPTHRHPITGKMGAPRVYFYRPGLLRSTSGGTKFESMLADQLSMARQTDNDSAPPDTPHKDIRSKLDLFDCARYTAVLVEELPVSGGLPSRGKGLVPEDRLPKEKLLDQEREELYNPLDMEIFVPEYDFGGAY